MRFSIIAQALYGAAAVSAVSIRQSKPVKEGALVDLSMFRTNTFPLLTPEQAAASAWKDPPVKGPIPKPEEAAPQVMSLSATATATCTNPAIVKEWRTMTETEKTNYVNANKCLFRLPARSGLPGTKNRWDDLVAVHQRMSRTVHGTGQFLPWHRYYLNVFERMLREECAYRGPMTWWDETRDAGRFSASPIFSMTHFGRGPLKTSTNQGTCIITGVFAHTTLNIGPGQNNIPHCLARAVDENLSKAVTQTFVNNCNAHHNFNEMQKCSYYGPHAYGHNAVGAVMSDMDTSPGDPLFFMHHQFINHNWRIWQNGNRAGRLYQINGYTTQTQPATGWQTVTLDYQLSSLGLRPTVTIRDVMDTMGGFLCYRYDY